MYPFQQRRCCADEVARERPSRARGGASPPRRRRAATTVRRDPSSFLLAFCSISRSACPLVWPALMWRAGGSWPAWSGSTASSRTRHVPPRHVPQRAARTMLRRMLLSRVLSASACFRPASLLLDAQRRLEEQDVQEKTRVAALEAKLADLRTQLRTEMDRADDATGDVWC